jgi:hypothetical protein
MAHIGIHRLGSGEREEGGAKHGEGDSRSRVNEVCHRMMRAEGAQNHRRTRDSAEAE